jgi:hypothetical protein
MTTLMTSFRGVRQELGTVKRNKPKAEKEDLAIRMRLLAETVRQANQSQDELAIAELLEQGAERIEQLESRLQRRPA